MNEPPTMIIWDSDEERTLVDPARLAGPERAFTGSGDAAPSKSPSVVGERSKFQVQPRWKAANARLSSYKRQIIEGGAVLTILFGLGVVAYQQSKVAEALRDTVGMMRVPRRGIVAARSTEGIGTQEVPKAGEVDPQAFVTELAADGREALELRGASLIASNDFPAALTQYETLARRFPGDNTFRDVVSVLKAKLRCDQSAELGSGVCP